MAGSWKIGTLKAFLNADSTQFDRTMVRAQLTAQTVGKNIVGFISRIGAPVTFAGAIYGMGRMVKSLDDIAKNASVLGVSGEVFQKWTFAAERTGTSIEYVNGALRRGQKLIGEAGIGNREAIDTLTRLGLSYEGLRDLSPDKQFDAIAAALNKVTNNTDRAALQTRIFGRGGLVLNNFLKDYIALGDRAAEVGIVDDQTLKNAELVQDAVTDIRKSIFGIVAESGFVDFLGRAAKKAWEIEKSMRSIPGAPQGSYSIWEKIKRFFSTDRAWGRMDGRLTFDEARNKLNYDFERKTFGRSMRGEDIKNAIYDLYGAPRTSYLKDVAHGGLVYADANRRARLNALERYNTEKGTYMQEQLAALGFYGAGGPPGLYGKRKYDFVDRPADWDKAMGAAGASSSGAAAAPIAQAAAAAAAAPVADKLGEILARTFPDAGDRVAKWREGLDAKVSGSTASAALGSLAQQGSTEAYRIISSQTQALKAPMEKTAENTRKAADRLEEIAANTASLSKANENTLELALIEGE